MADTLTGDTFRIQSISMAGTTFSDCIGGSITENITWLENTAGTRVTPCSVIDKYTATATAEFQKAVTPAARGQKSDVVYVLSKMDNAGGTVTVTLKNCRAGAFKADFNSKPHKYTQDATYSADETEDLAPITVGA